MKTTSLVLFALSCLLAITFCYRNQRTYSQTTKASSPALSKAEQDLLNEINQARANPQAYAGYLEKLKPFFKGRLYDPSGNGGLETQEGWNAVEDAIKFLRAAKPLAALTMSQGLCLAAQSHVKDQSQSGSTGHKGGDRTMIEDRVKPFGSWQGGIGENLAYGDESARDRLLMWLIDDGFANRGHRNRLMSGSYKAVGVSCGPHPEYKIMCVVTLAGSFSEKASAQAATNANATRASSDTNRAANTNAAKPANGKSNSNTRTTRPYALI